MLILIVDDHELIRAGLKQALQAAGHNIVGEAASLAEARAELLFTQPDLVLVDVNLPDGSGLELITPLLRCIVLTLGDDPTSLRQAHRRGAAAYVLKGEPVTHLLTIIEQLESSTYHFAAPALPQNRFDLTQRELDVIQILQTGWSAKEMASHLFLSEATVKTHLASIYRKLGVKNRTQAIVVALANHLIAE
jgi:DNA-binding NarL/FixJ family response regulator